VCVLLTLHVDDSFFFATLKLEERRGAGQRPRRPSRH